MKKLRFTTAYSILTMIFVMGLIPLQVNAQNVTVKPSTGSTIAAVPETVEGASGDYDVFFTRGGFATWRHEQLCLTMTTSDAPTLTSNGQLANPANNIFARSATNELEIGRGAIEATRNSYMTFVLPKGYRFTGYEIVFSRNRSDFGNNDNSYWDNTNNPNTNGTTVFGETNASFEYMSDYTKTITYNASATIDNGSVTIKHEDETGMSNILYFRLTDNDNNTTGRMVVTLHSVTLYFTPEENYTPAVPVGSIAEGVSAVDIPFATGKVDYGPIQRRTYDGQTRVSYGSAYIQDMPANLTLYEAESVTGGTHFDGTQGNVVEYKDGSIFDVQGYFRLGGKKNENGEDVEQVYYLETPTYVTLPDDNHTKNPVGFRIVGAELDYNYGIQQAEGTSEVDVFYITYTSGNTTYYLNTNGRFVTDTKTPWSLDGNWPHNGDVYLIANVTGNWGYSYSLGIGTRSSANKLSVDSNNHLYFYHNNRNRLLKGETSSSTIPELDTGTSGAANWSTGKANVPVHAYTPAPFKLHVYGKDGVELQTIEVNSNDDNGSVQLSGFNNDAIKFGVEGVGLVRAVLTMQALDPYIDRMDVVCQDEQQSEIRMEQTFYADDFTVNGGEFWFYLPHDCNGDPVSISYENLWNHNADETYEGGSAEHNSRFNFVNSLHNKEFTGDNIYNNVAEAAADKTSVLERQKVDNIGKTKFHFNNADQMGDGGTGGTLTEYPFTHANYKDAGGDFYTQEFTVTENDQTQTAYVFTTDETRYNIAPTTAVQHRAYAYYEMIVHVSSHQYDPKVKLVKIYDNSCVEKNGEADDRPYYGAIVDALDGSNKHGFASYKAVEDAIDKVIANKADDYNHTNIDIDGADQILYVDMTQMKGLYAKTGETTFETYKNDKLSKNALVFLPSGVTVAYDNFAYKTDGGFRAANNVILTDKTPFYSPYEIQVPSQNYATYTRLITAPSEGAVTKASLILPFTLNVEDGLHKNDTEDGFQFKLRTMTSFNDQPEGSGRNGYDYYGDGYFNLVEGQIAPANTPYMVEAISPNDGTYSFIAAQKGSNILPTTPEAVGNPAKIQGETVNVGSNTITNYGSYSGAIIPKQNNVFYFNRDKYVSSLNLPEQYDAVYSQPFRTYYEYVGKNGARISMFNVIFDADYVKTGDVVSDDAGLVDGINATSQKAFTITTANGVMNITAKQDVNVNIKSLSGISIANLNMKAGEQQSVNVPTGVYIVNNSKISIK